MTAEQIFLFALLGAVLGMLLWGRLRYDVVAFAALVIAFIGGAVPAESVFSGFGHPATIIIALVLVVSRGLTIAGAVELITRQLMKASPGQGAHIGIMSALAAGLSAIMNNVAALALLMPVDIQAAGKAKRSPAVTLMPLSFASILGGMVTLIGTPPNVVIATFRSESLGEPFSMFDFAPVGLTVAIVGVLFVALVGWRLLPEARRKQNVAVELRDLEGYIAEVVVPDESDAIDQKLRELDPLAEENDVAILGLVRQGSRLPGSARAEQLRRNDVLVLEGGPEAIEQFIGSAGLEFRKSKDRDRRLGTTSTLAEVVVPQGARIEGRSAMDVRLLYRQGVTLLGVSRRGQRFRERVRKLRIQAGDILLLLGPEDRLPDVVAWLGCLPLAGRGLQVTQRQHVWLSIGLFAAAIVAASAGLLYLPMALAAVVLAYVAVGIVPVSQLYEAVEWPVIVLLGSLIPVAAALESSGGTGLIADLIVDWSSELPPALILALLMVVTMTLSDVLNNVATALIAAPVGVEVANRLGVDADPFLMAVAVAASCAFLTPIGHKNNTIIMGPGGYRFGDYWRMGLPLEILVVLVSVPMILLVWPLHG